MEVPQVLTYIDTLWRQKGRGEGVGGRGEGVGGRGEGVGGRGEGRGWRER